ncbi:SH3 domain-containing protein [Devosia sp. 2618]|uniref:SH3 domain-containing protein n=1 Tax=Devosia sp. 2618 TaxID=3156454 RepID=UPI00339B5C4B
MALRNKLIAGGLAALALIATTAAAMAAPAYATSNVNVRSGPGTGYAAIDTLRRGEQVDVQQCQGSWCYVIKNGPDGWVSANYLDRAGGGWQPDPRPPVWNPAPPPRPPVWNPPPRPPVWNPNPRPPHWNPNPPRPPVWDPYPTRPPNWGGQRPPRPYPDNSNGSVCFNGPNGYFCVGN